MITLKGTYADHCNGPLPDETLEYVCRLIRYKDTFYTPVNEPVELKDGDVLKVCGKGTWFALYRKPEKN